MTDRDDSRDADPLIVALRARVAELEGALEEHAKVELALRESEQKLRSVLENAPDSITVMRPDGVLLYVNRMIPPRVVDDAIGTKATEYLTEADARCFMAAVEAASTTGRPQTLEVRTRSGSQWETRLVPL